MRLLSSALLLFTLVSSVQARIIHYNGEYMPYHVPGTGEEAFSWADFGNDRSLTADGFAMDTREGTGNWFGNHAGHNVVTSYWTLGTPAQGNYVKLISKVSPFGSGWSMYMYDGQYSSAFYFENGYAAFDAPDQPTSHTVFLNTNVLHTYEFWLKAGKVAYAIDSIVYYAGDANVAAANQYLIIGDGSAYGGGGVGTMTVRQTDIYTGTDFASAPAMPLSATTPEPVSILLSGAGLGLLAWRRCRLNRL